ncbi:hypothetical protein VP01_621g1 [Puccinia sorghi]|uniref:Uncharacterized protein n=1 Tax=Puccinia sorghi TaxID=27349 RepID=A0A0L6UGI7_9BASI|nr:hypothetical protein VP01_621g1 [Puccinia sorghi]
MELNIKAIMGTVAESILQLIGYIAARRGILDVKVRRQMNRVNQSLIPLPPYSRPPRYIRGVFTPALMFSKVAFSLTPQMLAQLWVIPVGYLVLSGLSASVAWGLGKCFGLSKTRRNLAIAGATFMNSNTLPIALMQTMAGSLSLKWKADDTQEKALDRSFQYLVLCAVLGAVLRWSVGITLFNSCDKPSGDAKTKRVSTINQSAETVETDVDKVESQRSNEPISQPKTIRLSRFHGDSQYLCPSTPLTPATLYDFPAPTHHSDFHKALIENDLPVPKPETIKKTSLRRCWGAVRQRMATLRTHLPISDKFIDAVAELLNPPLVRKLNEKNNIPRRKNNNKIIRISSIAAIIVACVSPLQAGLAKVKPLREFISTAAAKTLVTRHSTLRKKTGAFFYRPPKEGKSLTEEEKTDLRKEKRRESRRKMTDIILTLLARHIVTPLIMLPILAVICQHSHLEVFHDPVFILSATLIIGSPAAITLAQMTAKADLDFFDEMISKLLLWSYALVTQLIKFMFTFSGPLLRFSWCLGPCSFTIPLYNLYQSLVSCIPRPLFSTSPRVVV